MIETDLKRAIHEIRVGHPVALPTETVYGLAARIDNPQSIKSIFELKQRPFFDPLIVHVGSIQQAQSVVSWWPPEAQRLAEVAWPGPLTMVLPKASHINPLITSGLESVAVRWPKHADFQKVLDEVKIPLAAPSANKFGRTSPTTAQHVLKEFKDDPVLIFDGGPCEVGIESTVVKISQSNNKTQISVLRKGHFSESDLKKILREFPIEFTQNISSSESPGHMKHHYMPQVPLIIVAIKKPLSGLAEEIFKNISRLPDEIDHVKINKLLHIPKNIMELKLSSDAKIAAREFYSELRRISESGCDCIIYLRDNSNTSEPWDALNDRMNKAASLILT